MNERFIRTELLLGAEAMKKLSVARVAVFGLGGVGGYAVEALARSGIGALELIDKDVISLSNINRQILATTQTLGMLKVDAAAARVRSIAPDCQVTTHNMFYLPENRGEIDLACCSYVIDAIDTVTAKLFLISEAQAADVPVISSMGTGNKLDPSAFEVAMIDETSVCPLARIMRKEARRRGLRPFKVVYSREEPQPEDEREFSVEPDPGRHSVPASIAFVPSVAGLLLAGEVIRDIIGR